MTKSNIDTSTTTNWFCDNIKLTHSISKYQKLGNFSISNNTDLIRLHFGLKGNYEFFYKQLDKSFDLIGGHHNIMYSNGFDIEIENKTFEIETFGIQFPKELFINLTQNANDQIKRFSENILLGKGDLLSQNWGAIDYSIEQVIRQIINCNYSNEIKKMFLLSKSIELLVLTAESYSYSENKKEIFIKNKSDKEKIIAVRDLINERLNCPPNLSEIAKIIGLNEYKLKLGFKEVFNNTVFEYLTEQRLNIAMQYLKDTQKTSSEIAYSLGYATPQHFNNAFKKKFGFTPNSVRKNPYLAI
ncbi:MAG: helix-turn-helix transcriptional regulator [Bacteroidales bacterium]|nr:helix-turn-helix transcriptional regulator [Bacteroidales bacterium]